MIIIKLIETDPESECSECGRPFNLEDTAVYIDDSGSEGTILHRRCSRIFMNRLEEIINKLD